MLVEQAQTFTPEQINGFFAVCLGLFLSNIGQLTGWALRKYKKNIKEGNDIKAAHDKIRLLTERVKTLEEKGEKL